MEDLINHPYKGPNFDRCHTKLKIELESCRCRFRTYSWTFWIGGQKKVVSFFQTGMAPSTEHNAVLQCPGSYGSDKVDFLSILFLSKTKTPYYFFIHKTVHFTTQSLLYT